MKINNNKPLFITFIIMLTTVPIFSTDMYLPALPKMVELFGTSLKLLNLTLILFFIFFAASSLVWGTLSDKYGRKPILITSISAYVVASFLCAIAGNVYQLILFRAIQGIGGGATMAVAIAMVKDVFSGKERGRVLVYLSSLMAVAPIVAPIVGAQILQVTSWRGTFVILGLFGTLLIVGSLLLSETAVRNPDKSVLKTFSSLKTLLKNPGFSLPLILFSIASMPILMFVGSASDIYITGFGLSEQTFSFFFGFNAAFAVIGPFAYILLARRFSTQAIIGLAFLLTAASGIWIVLSGNQSPVMFALAIVPSALGSSLSRPPNMNIILEQGKKDTGAASSLMNFSFMMTGCTGMLFISLDWENRILVYGLSALVAGLVPLLLWPMAWRRCDPAQLEANTETAQLGSY